MLDFRPKVFGSRRRTELLILLALLEESYPTELARLLNAHQYSVQTIIKALEAEGVVATREMGGVRRVQLNPRFAAFKELRALLLKMADGESELQAAVFGLRRRPRRQGKNL